MFRDESLTSGCVCGREQSIPQARRDQLAGQVCRGELAFDVLLTNFRQKRIALIPQVISLSGQARQLAPQLLQLTLQVFRRDLRIADGFALSRW